MSPAICKKYTELQELPAFKSPDVAQVNKAFDTATESLDELSTSTSNGRDSSLNFQGPDGSREVKDKPQDTSNGKHGPIQEDQSIYCGMGSFQPSCLQKCRNMKCFTVCFSLTGIVTSALNVYMNSQITTLEKQFNLSSSLSGLLMSCNDIGYLVVTLFMSYYTRRTHVPRALALSTIIYGLSGLLCTVAFFGTRDDLRSPPTGQENSTMSSHLDIPMCVNNTRMTSCGDESHSSKASVSEYWRTIAILTLGIGMALQGVAKSPRAPFLGTYVDDNVPKTKTSMYLGTMIGLSISGPALAFTLGGVFSRMYITLEPTNMSPKDPRWLGAWWLGFLLFGSLGLVAGIPLAFFPRRLIPVRPGQDEAKVQPDKNKLITDFKGFFQVLMRLVINPVYICLILSNGVYLLCVSGTIAFLPKYLETQFNIPAWQANMYIGTMNVVAVFVGTIIGGCLTTRFKLSPLKCLKVFLGTKCLGTVIVAMGYFTGCSQPVFQQSDSQDCACDSMKYFPVCGADNLNYFSPCHAGCTTVLRNNTFIQCQHMMGNETQTAFGNLCHSNCHTLYIFLAIMFVTAFVTSLAMMPAFIVTVRSVPENDKPVAIGLSSFTSTLLGWLPGPVVFGIVIDSTCIVWRRKGCQATGACSLYNIEDFRVQIHSLMVGLRVVSIIFSLLALVAASYCKSFSFQEHEDLEIAVATDSTRKRDNSEKNRKIKTADE